MSKAKQCVQAVAIHVEDVGLFGISVEGYNSHQKTEVVVAIYGKDICARLYLLKNEVIEK